MDNKVTRAGLALAVVLAVLLPGAPAWAHNSLVDAQPAKNATLTKAPAEVKLSFLQKLNPEFTTIVVSDAAQQRIAADPPAVAGKTGTLTLSAPLANGDYTVAYQVVSTDGHTVKGSYKFSVTDPAAAPPSAAPAPVSSASSAAPVPPAIEPLSSSATEEDGGSGWVRWAGLAAMAAAIAAGFLVLRSRRGRA